MLPPHVAHSGSSPGTERPHPAQCEGKNIDRSGSSRVAAGLDMAQIVSRQSHREQDYGCGNQPGGDRTAHHVRADPWEESLRRFDMELRHPLQPLLADDPAGMQPDGQKEGAGSQGHDGEENAGEQKRKHSPTEQRPRWGARKRLWNLCESTGPAHNLLGRGLGDAQEMHDGKRSRGNEHGGNRPHRAETKPEEYTPEKEFLKNGDNARRRQNPEPAADRDSIFPMVNTESQVSRSQSDDRQEGDGEPGEKISSPEWIPLDSQLAELPDSDPPERRPEHEHSGELKAAAEIAVKREALKKWQNAPLRQRRSRPIQRRGEQAREQDDPREVSQQAEDDGI